MSICKCYKVDGSQCHYKAKPNSIYCGVHKNCKRKSGTHRRALTQQESFNFMALPNQIKYSIIQQMSREEILELMATNKQIAQFIKNYNLYPKFPIGDRVKLAEMFTRKRPTTYKYMTTHRFPDINNPYKRIDAQPVLTRAIKGGTTKDIEYLLEHGADPNAFETGGHVMVTDVLIMIYGSNLSLPEAKKRIELLLKYGANLNPRITKYGAIPPLLFAIIQYLYDGSKKWLDMIEYLLKHGAKVDYKMHATTHKIPENHIRGPWWSGGWQYLQYNILRESTTILDYINNLIQAAKGGNQYWIRPHTLERLYKIRKLLLPYKN